MVILGGYGVQYDKHQTEHHFRLSLMCHVTSSERSLMAIMVPARRRHRETGNSRLICPGKTRRAIVIDDSQYPGRKSIASRLATWSRGAHVTRLGTSASLTRRWHVVV